MVERGFEQVNKKIDNIKGVLSWNNTAIRDSQTKEIVEREYQMLSQMMEMGKEEFNERKTSLKVCFNRMILQQLGFLLHDTL